MKANLIVQTNEVTIRDYTLIEDEGFGNLVSGSEAISIAGIKMEYEDDEDNPGKNMIVITAPDLPSIFKFLDFAGIPVHILT